MRLATPLVAIVLLGALAGCGSSEGTTGTAPDQPQTAAQVQVAWEKSPDCTRPPGASRWGCSVGAYRCQGVVTDRGWSVSCSKPGRSVDFLVRP